MKKTYIVSAVLILSGLAASAQNVGINVSGATPHASSILDLNTGNTFTSPNGKGMLIPNVALTGTGDATTVASPATSLMVYNTATAGAGATAVTPGYYYWDGAQWVQFQSSSNASQDWKLTGNAGTTAGTNFVGTTDAIDFVTKTNNTERMRVTSSGNVGIGTTAPTTKLQVNGPSTGAIKIVDGNQAAGKVLTSDANGVGTWQVVSGTTISGTLITGPVNKTGNVPANIGSITLPTGKWQIIYSAEHRNVTTNADAWIYLSTTATATISDPTNYNSINNFATMAGYAYTAGNTAFITLGATTTIYLMGWQNTPAAWSVTGKSLTAISIF